MPQVQHIVLFKFKPEITEEKIKEIFAQLAELPKKIPGIIYYASGPNCSNQGLNKSYSDGFIMTFESIEARDAYLPHPEHKKVAQEIIKNTDDVIVFDFKV